MHWHELVIRIVYQSKAFYFTYFRMLEHLSYRPLPAFLLFVSSYVLKLAAWFATIFVFSEEWPDMSFILNSLGEQDSDLRGHA